MIITFIGLVAAALTAIAGLPQFIKSLKTKSTKDLSLLMIIQLLVGFTLWTIYGIFKKDIAIIFAQIVAYAFYVPLLILKLKYK